MSDLVFVSTVTMPLLAPALMVITLGRLFMEVSIQSSGSLILMGMRISFVELGVESALIVKLPFSAMVSSSM